MTRLIQITVGILLTQVILLMGLTITHVSSQSSVPVAKQGIQTKMISEHVNLVRSSELNGRYKMRLGETTFEPGGYLGKHHHTGPGIRLITFGEITSVSAGKPEVFKAGESFYDSGDTVHELYNKTNKIVRVMNFEILPSDWKGSSAISVHK